MKGHKKTSHNNHKPANSINSWTLSSYKTFLSMTEFVIDFDFDFDNDLDLGLHLDFKIHLDLAYNFFLPVLAL